MCKICGSPSNRDMCTSCETKINMKASMAERGQVPCIDLGKPIDLNPVELGKVG